MNGIVKLQAAEFDAIPKYMKGRLTLEKVNGMIELLNQLYADKYAVMLQNPNKLPHELRQKYWVPTNVFINNLNLTRTGRSLNATKYKSDFSSPKRTSRLPCRLLLPSNRQAWSLNSIL
jgi:hypothetical protein